MNASGMERGYLSSSTLEKGPATVWDIFSKWSRKGERFTWETKTFFRREKSGRRTTPNKGIPKNLNAIILTLHKCQSCPAVVRSDPLIDILNTKQRHFHTQVLDMGRHASTLYATSIYLTGFQWICITKKPSNQNKMDTKVHKGQI